MRPPKVAKALAVERITEMRAKGYSLNEIAVRVGLSRSRITEYIRDFKIPMASKRTKICPHCGMDTKKRRA